MHGRWMCSRLSRDGVVQISAKQKRLIQILQAVVYLFLDERPPFLLMTEEHLMKRIKRGDIYLADLSPVVGSEQDGIRPVLILQNDTGNQYSPTTIVAAITSKTDKTTLPTHVKIKTDVLKCSSIVLLEQIRTIDKTRLNEYIGKLDKDTMGKVDHAIITSLGVKYMEVLL